MTGERRGALPVRQIRAGDRRALGRAISAIENGAPEADALLKALYRETGRVRIVGFTGPLGVGKSSLINALVAHLRGQGRRVAVIAVDPSSPFSGGSVLGDRIRFDRPADDDGVFFRSMASRGAAGGVAAATREAARILEVAGFDDILVETVGSGQVDTAIRDIATTSVVVLVPHLGDEVQTLKAGLFEIADVFCVNKADLPGADAARRDLVELAALGTERGGWRSPVVLTSTVEPSGIPALWEAVEAHEAYLERSGRRPEAERRRLAKEIVGRVRDHVDAELTERLERDPELRRLLDQVVAREVDPRTAAERLHRTRRARG